MSRIRTIKPSFWDSPGTARASLRARLLYIAMWNWADDYGVGDANPQRLLGFAFPNDLDIAAADMPVLLNEIKHAFGVVFFAHEGRSFFVIPSWTKHQRIDKKLSKGGALLAAAEAAISAQEDKKQSQNRQFAEPVEAVLDGFEESKMMPEMASSNPVEGGSVAPVQTPFEGVSGHSNVSLEDGFGSSEGAVENFSADLLDDVQKVLSTSVENFYPQGEKALTSSDDGVSELSKQSPENNDTEKTPENQRSGNFREVSGSFPELSRNFSELPGTFPQLPEKSFPQAEKIPPGNRREEIGNRKKEINLGERLELKHSREQNFSLSPFCKNHPTGIDTPCRACGVARLRWEAERSARTAHTPELEKLNLEAERLIREERRRNTVVEHRLLGGKCLDCCYGHREHVFDVTGKCQICTAYKTQLPEFAGEVVA